MQAGGCSAHGDVPGLPPARCDSRKKTASKETTTDQFRTGLSDISAISGNKKQCILSFSHVSAPRHAAAVHRSWVRGLPRPAVGGCRRTRSGDDLFPELARTRASLGEGREQLYALRSRGPCRAGWQRRCLRARSALGAAPVTKPAHGSGLFKALFSPWNWQTAVCCAVVAGSAVSQIR